MEGSLKAGGIEGSIILVAAAFELLAWTLFCEDPEHRHKKCADEQRFDKEVTAKTKLELLLRWAGASTKLPVQYTTLKQAAKQQAWNNNGAEIFLAVRNSLTHSAPQNRQTRASISPEALYEAYMLGMGYLKGLLQKLFDYPMPFVSVIQNSKR